MLQDGAAEIVKRVIKDVLSMFMKKKNYCHFNFAIYVFPYVCLSVLIFPISYNLKQISFKYITFQYPQGSQYLAGVVGRWGRVGVGG